jgi:hypothetical protein
MAFSASFIDITKQRFTHSTCNIAEHLSVSFFFDICKEIQFHYKEEIGKGIFIICS